MIESGDKSRRGVMIRDLRKDESEAAPPQLTLPKLQPMHIRILGVHEEPDDMGARGKGDAGL
jgi:hypothetical protein